MAKKSSTEKLPDLKQASLKPILENNPPPEPIAQQQQ